MAKATPCVRVSLIKNWKDSGAMHACQLFAYLYVCLDSFLDYFQYYSLFCYAFDCSFTECVCELARAGLLNSDTF